MVCTPIFQDLWRYNRWGRVGSGRAVFSALGRDDVRLEDLRALVNLLRAGPAEALRRVALCAGLARHALWGGGRSAVDLQRGLLANSQAVVFNSPLEGQSVARCLGLSASEINGEVVPVGIDPAELQGADPALFSRRFGLEGFVLSVGRIEDLKNQLTLVDALADLPVPLVIIGGVNPRHRLYNWSLRRAAAARPRTMLLRGLPRKLLISAMAAASVHVLPSWFETAGLTSLEAALTGCAVVSTDGGYARAYLGDDAHYCDPADPGSIRQAVEQALRTGPSHKLRRRVLKRFTVDASAAAMEQIYRRVAV